MTEVPAHMMAIDPESAGGPEVLVSVERPVPSPGTGEVLIKVAAAGVNRPDVLQRRGFYAPPPGAPTIPGLEVSGTIIALGSGVDSAHLGQPVCALLAGGGYATHVVADEWSPQIDIGAAVLIPEGYVEDLSTRLSLYRRLADLQTDNEREAFAAELIDRFGPLPEETKQLLEITAVKILCKKLGVAKVSAGPKGALLAFRDNAPLDGAKLIAYVQKQLNRLKLRPDMKLVLSGAWVDAPARLAGVKSLLRDMSGLL